MNDDEQVLALATEEGNDKMVNNDGEQMIVLVPVEEIVNQKRRKKETSILPRTQNTILNYFHKM